MKTTKLFLAIIICLSILAGCSSENELVVNIDTAYNQLTSSIEFADELMEINFPTINDFYTVNQIDIVKYKVSISTSGASAEEIAMFEAKDTDAAKLIKSACEERIEDLKFSFNDYKPEEIEKLNNAIIMQNGKYVMLGIAENHENVKKIFEQYLKN